MGIKERQERDRESVRRAILDAARELFVLHGFEQVSIRKIAERIEYSPAAIYGYFPSKDDIFFALAEEGFGLLAGDQAVRTCPPDRDSPLEHIRDVFWRFYVFSREHPQYFSLMFVDRSVPRISREYERFSFAREMKEWLVTQVDAAVAAGQLPATVPPSVIFRLLTSTLIGLAVTRASDRLAHGEDADLLAHDAIDVTLAGLRSVSAVRSAPPFCRRDTASADGLDSPAVITGVRS